MVVCDSPAQRFYDALVDAVDAETFDGRICDRCLIGQLATKCGFDATQLERNERLAEVFAIRPGTIASIDVQAMYYGNNLSAALDMARATLGL